MTESVNEDVSQRMMKTAENSFEVAAKKHLEVYKNRKLQIPENGIYSKNGQLYGHILPRSRGEANILISKNHYRIEGSVIYFDNGDHVKLHSYWYHLNSSQILCINYFQEFLDDIPKLTELLRFFNIPGEPLRGRFEVMLSDSSSIDFVIELENEKKVYIEIKYTESSFGVAGSKKTDYLKRKLALYNRVEIPDPHYLKYYQFIRCTNLAVEGDYTVYLLPRQNKAINQAYDYAASAIRNFHEFDVINSGCK